MKENYIKQLSPCQSECNLNGGIREYCTACFRTLDEIKGWKTYTKKQCLNVLATLELRKKELDMNQEKVRENHD